MQDKCDRTRPLAFSRSQRSSTSLRCFLVCLASGGWISGEDGGSSVASEDAFLTAEAMMTREDGCAGASRAAVGVCTRHLW